MRIVHTADWHLGRLMFGAHLTEDQAYLLEELLRFLKDARPDVLLVSGDVFDRPVPPADAVALLDDFLCRCALDLGIPPIVIAGNHDSPLRLEFASRILARGRVHVVGSVAALPSVVELEDRWGPVYFAAIPFVDAATARVALAREDIANHRDALICLVEEARRAVPNGARSVLLAHAFITGALESESERPLSVGGADRVETSCLDGFSYAALGHLHRPQQIGNRPAAYAGSLMKYSFAESEDDKSIVLVELDAAGSCSLERVPLKPRRDVRKIRGFLKEILDGPAAGVGPEDYVMVTILDTDAIFDLMGKIRTVYPNVLHVEREAFARSANGRDARIDHRTLHDCRLFHAFYEDMTGAVLTAEQEAAYESVAEKVRHHEREG